MSDDANTLAQFVARRDKNLAYFEQHYPQVFRILKGYKLQRLQVNIIPENDEVDLIENGGLVYGGGAKKYARQEVEEFCACFGPGKRICSFIPPFHGDYMQPRYGQSRVNDLLEKSPVRAKNFQYYYLENFYPLVVFLGVGLGYHIEQMTAEKEVHHAVVVEPDIDRFAASLYSVDWQNIAGKYSAREGRTFHFIVGAKEEEYLVWAAVWNRLIDLCPQFPVTTLFFNHQKTEFFDRVSERVNKDLVVFLMSWGHYDDEIRQLNNALHNFHRGIKELPEKKAGGMATPVCIVGGGPSFNQRYESLKKVRDKVLVVSCGTALKSMLSYGIFPDIHVELESDLKAFIALSVAAPKEELKKIRVIGPSQLSPLIFDAVGDARMYYKAESAIAQLFGKASGHVISNATPTCTVAAVATSIAMGFKKLFLFGLDFGFVDLDEHHAKGSIYYEKVMKKQYNRRDLLQIEAVNGGKAYSTPNYFTSKRKVENLIKGEVFNEGLEVYSCSDVAEIEETTWLDESQFLQQIDSCASDRQADLDYLFAEDASKCSLELVESKLKYIEENLKSLSKDVEKLLSSSITTLEEVSLAVSTINWYLESILKPRTPEFYFFVRGAIRHYLCAGFAHAFATQDVQARQEYLLQWKASMLSAFAEMPAHFAQVVYKRFDIDEDLWIKQSNREAEDAINPFFTTDIADLELKLK